MRLDKRLIPWLIVLLVIFVIYFLHINLKKPLNLVSSVEVLVDPPIFFSENIELRPNPPEVQAIALKADMPWESAGLGYFAVLDDPSNNIIRMYYSCHQERKKLNLCYAESEDGISFKRIFLTDNNILDIELSDGVSVFRLKDGNYGLLVAKHVGYHPQLNLYSSVDGINFKKELSDAVENFAMDSQNIVFYDESKDKYLAFVRSWNALKLIGPDTTYRTVSVLELDDPFEDWPIPHDTPPLWSNYWTKGVHRPAVSSELPVIMAPDDKDPPNTHIYTPSVNSYNGNYYAFPSIYEHFPDPWHGGLRTNDGKMNIQLAVSKDGYSWKRLRLPYLDYGHLDPKVLLIYMGQGIIDRGDYIYQYAHTYSNLHQDESVDSKIYVLKQRKERFAYLTPIDDKEGEVHFKLIPNGSRVLVDAEIENNGYIRVKAESNNSFINGIVSKVVENGKGRLKVSFDNGHALPIDEEVTLKFYLKSSKLFAIKFVE